MDKVRKEIIKNARNEAKSILKQAEKERKNMLENAEKSLAEKKTLLDEEAKQVIELYESTSKAEANSEKNKLRLVLEKELIDEVFQLAKEKLGEIPKKKREKHLKLLKNKLDKRYSVLFTSKQDKSILRAKQRDITGGLIAETKDGNSKVDLSYDNLLQNVRKENLAEITKMLFG
jgi:V/A-type H+-transporting ATPase subunit E